MPDEPRFLGSNEPTEEPREPAREEPPAAEPTPEQRAAIEAVLAGRIEEIAPRKCISCDSRECAPVYVLLNHSSVEIARRYQIFGSISIQRSTLKPCVMPMCERCYARVAANRRRQRLGAYLGIAGIVIAMGYFVAAIARAPTAVALTLLFGGGGLLAAAMVNAVTAQSALHAQLQLPKLPGMAVVVASKDRRELDHALERYELHSRELQNELDRKSMEASALPEARMVPKDR